MSTDMKKCPFLRVVEDMKRCPGYCAKCEIPEHIQQVCMWLRENWLARNGTGDICTNWKDSK